MRRWLGPALAALGLLPWGPAARAQGSPAGATVLPATPTSEVAPLPPLPSLPLDSAPVRRVTMAEFVAEVGRVNLDYAAQAFSVPIADAQVSVAHLYPNPTVDWGLGADVSGQHQATAYDVSLTQTILLGGKRGARTTVAEGQRAQAKAQLDDFLRTLRGTAGDAYVDAVRTEQAFRRKRETADDLDQLVVLNQRRVQAGDIPEVDLVQSRVDAAQAHGDLVSAWNDLRAARLAMLALLTPRPTADTLVAPIVPEEIVSPPAAGPGGLLPSVAPAITDSTRVTVPAPLASAQWTLSVDSLVSATVATRPDVIAARRAQDAAAAGVGVARGDRVPDIDLSVGTSYFTRGTSPIDPTPEFSQLTFGLSLPIPLSNFSHGELSGAQYVERQAQKAVQSAEWKAAIDVRQAWTRYQAASLLVAQYASHVLRDAERVRRAKLYSYQHGAASLLDVLTAEGTANAVYLAAYDAQAEYGHALVALGQATGTWSIVYADEANAPK